MDLCDACEIVAKELSALIAGGYGHPLSKKPTRHGLDFCELDTSRTRCRLCQLLFSHNPLVRSHKDSLEEQGPPYVSTEGYAIEILPKWDTDDGLNSAHSKEMSREARKLLRWLHISVIRKNAQEDVSGPYEKLWPVVLQTYGIRDSPPVCTGSLWGRYRFQSSGSKDAFSLFRQWLKNCLCYHDRCKHDDLGDRPGRAKTSPLPTRVIDVGPSDNSSQPRLLITKGKRGNWIALSHCWGTSNLQPLKTTKENFEKHLKQIHLNDLPKSFQDAVAVTRALNVRYLWIDSLCIIQDDLEDWRRECECMGSVYRDSLITISAADATDSSQGFFSDTVNLSYDRLRKERDMFQYNNYRSPDEQYQLAQPWNGSIGEGMSAVTEAVEVPYHVNGNAGSFYISPKDEFDVQPMRSPLFRRGWVTQEWVLARRTIIFLKDAVVWACREVHEDERGNPVKLERPTVSNWQSLIEIYTKNRLTYESDRLAAIQGLANSLVKIRPDTYFAGVWVGDFPETLLWLKPAQSAISRKFSHLPSWTWARTTGPVGFQLRMRPHGSVGNSELEDISKLTKIGTSGELEIVGLMKQVESMVRFVYKQGTKESNDVGLRWTPMDVCFIKRCFDGQSNCRQSAFGSLHREGLSIILKVGGSRVGWAAWDVGHAPDGPIYCLALKLERSCMCAVLAIPESVKDAYHVLFLQKEPLSTTRFVRVGVGVIMKDDWFESALLCTVHLV